MEQKQTKWEFVYDEEIPQYDHSIFLGVISNGERFLFYRTETTDIADLEYIHIYSSIKNLYDNQCEEVSYLWRATNDSKLLEFLNNAGDDFCGEDCDIRNIPFENPHIYRHVGYYNDVADIRELAGESADDILDYYKHGYGHFYEDKEPEETDVIVREDEYDNKNVRFTADGRFAIFDGTWESWREMYADKEDGDDSDCFIDIYELAKGE